MALFGRKKSLVESGILSGATDWHSHILPGVDDGVASVSEAVDILQRYETAGVKNLWLTPHIMEDFPNATTDLKRRFEELCRMYAGSIKLYLASENMLDSLFEERLENKDFLPLGENGKYLLIETSYLNPPYGMEDMIKGIFGQGLTPVLAHPERYRYMQEKDYLKWRDRGALFQCNLTSFVGIYGETARKKAEWLLNNKMVDLIGSDLHRSSFFENLKLRPSRNSISPLQQISAKEVIVKEGN